MTKRKFLQRKFRIGSVLHWCEYLRRIVRARTNVHIYSNSAAFAHIHLEYSRRRVTALNLRVISVRNTKKKQNVCQDVLCRHRKHASFSKSIKLTSHEWSFVFFTSFHVRTAQDILLQRQPRFGLRHKYSMRKVKWGGDWSGRDVRDRFR